ncbi:DUF349 domain-containing protein [Comamonas endophytica]|uniref:DUF349 domain-containing protein n=1 Tax=Comamonas endophytica TaxID=2949090 RepID=A0ABY6GCD7_9BURK|nr:MULTISPECIES: DUF349 domain-containing protein [unclassified Acidovorax]MCD2513795.1 DUF349 domain-containing protein [Acidovorax sp. D4N7]UYG52202.1 DUF349 domain-containing protein [Acidovorax sp. 5MLIR]
MSDAPEVNPAPAKTSETHPLDALTGGAFSAETSGERASRIRDWLATQPAQDQLQEVFKELSVRDKGAARAVRERLDEIRRLETQEKIGVEWADKARQLLEAEKLNIADAIAWQRDAAKAGAALSREPLSVFKAQLAERVKVIEDLQHRVQVQREAAVLLAQRIEVLSTKPWRDAAAALEALSADVAHWQAQAAELTGDANWVSVDAKFPPQLENSRKQLLVVWDAFQSALALTQAAAQDEQAELPPVPVWADELRVARGLPAEAAVVAAKTAAAPAKPAAAPRAKPASKVAPEVAEAAVQAVRQALAELTALTSAAGEQPAQEAAPVDTAAVDAAAVDTAPSETTPAEPQAPAAPAAPAAARGKQAKAIAQLRAVLKQQGRHVNAELGAEVNAALLAAGDAQGWQGWKADSVREELVQQAESLLNRPDGQALGGRKMQESLRSLREQWKQADQGAPANHALWKRFDEACNAAHKVVEAWLDRVRSEAANNKAQRVQLIEEVKAWAAAQGDSTDWKSMSRSLRQFGERWRDGGHVGEKMFAELQPLWKQAIAAAEAPLHAAQKASLARRHAMIDEAVALGEAPTLRIDAVKALQQRWQAEAQAVPLDRKHEQKLWDAFRKPLDDAFNRKGSERGSRAQVELSERDRQVLDASKALEAANASGDAQQIRAAMTALEAALHSQAQAQESAAKADAAKVEAAPAADADAGAEAAAKPAAVHKPVVAVRGDDRPGMKKEAPAAAGRPGRPGERRDSRDSRDGRPGGDRGGRFGDRGDRPMREDRGPRLADPAFRAQRDALEHAQAALRKLAVQAHGEALTQLLNAWEKRDAEQLPSVQELGGRVTPQVRSAWAKSIAAPVAGDAGEALLRLEMAADVPTPAEQITARRTLQLQLLTRRNDPSPAETWGQDAARVLASARDEGSARRLQNALKALLRK